jgi:hypothetical protein
VHIGTTVEMQPDFAMEGQTKIDRYALRAKSPLPPMPFIIRQPPTCVELTWP